MGRVFLTEHLYCQPGVDTAFVIVRSPEPSFESRQVQLRYLDWHVIIGASGQIFRQAETDLVTVAFSGVENHCIIRAHDLSFRLLSCFCSPPCNGIRKLLAQFGIGADEGADTFRCQHHGNAPQQALLGMVGEGRVLLSPGQCSVPYGNHEVVMRERFCRHLLPSPCGSG